METTQITEQELQSQRERFVATLGHDLKNPIISQTKALELLLKGVFGDINKEQKEILQILLDSCKYMDGMLSLLLATYRNNGGLVKLNFENFSFVELIKECVSEITYVAKDKGINISIHNNCSEEFVQADRVQIKRVLMNLLSNGIKYAFRETELELFVHSSLDRMGFEYVNKSPYIPEDQQESIFEQYVSYATSHKESGVGLGLYASKKIIEGHCGEIFVNSYNDNRNSFAFRIPIKPCDDLIDKFVQF